MANLVMNLNPQFQLPKETRKREDRNAKKLGILRAKDWTRISRMGAKFGPFVVENVGEGD